MACDKCAFSCTNIGAFVSSCMSPVVIGDITRSIFLSTNVISMGDTDNNAALFLAFALRALDVLIIYFYKFVFVKWDRVDSHDPEDCSLVVSYGRGAFFGV